MAKKLLKEISKVIDKTKDHERYQIDLFAALRQMYYFQESFHDLIAMLPKYGVQTGLLEGYTFRFKGPSFIDEILILPTLFQRKTHALTTEYVWTESKNEYALRDHA